MSREFLSRENTSNLYKEVLRKNKLQALPKKTKEIIVNLLISNMKSIYKQIDSRKVNKNNVYKVMEQFNNMCLQETSKNLSNSEIFSGEDSQVSRVKFARDFNSTPRKEVKFLDRPSNGKSSHNRRSSESSESSRSSLRIDNKIRQSSSSLDNMFQPIGQNFNNSDMGYMSTRDTSSDINRQMEQITKLRQNETDRANRRPPTPEFLKSEKTQKDKPNYDNNNSNRPDDNRGSIEAMNSSAPVNNNELGSYSGSGDNYFSLDQIDKPLVTNEIVEDNSTFEERLKRLQSDREGINVPNQSNSRPQINNTQMNNNNMEEFRNQRESDIDRRQAREMEEMRAQREAREMEEMRAQRDREAREMEEMRAQRDRESREMRAQREITSERGSDNSQLQMLLDRLNNLEKNNSSNNNEIINKLKEENKKLTEEMNSITSLKNRISDEFKELTKKNDLFKSNMSILNQRELELNSKEAEINQLINNYRQILGSRFYQMNITSKDKSSKYSYFFNKLTDIISIKIISYSMPTPRYNVDKNNNIFKYTQDNEMKELNIIKGKYNINQLLEFLNEKTDLKFNLNINQKITIESNKNFKLEQNNFINRTLGVNVNDTVEEIDNKFQLNASGTWDLRLHDKLFLYITNINSSPISIIYLNGHGESHIQFEEPIELSQLDVELRDINDNLYDFNNLDHSINLQLELVNQFKDINRQAEFELQ